MSKTLKINCYGYKINADWYEGMNHERVLLILQGFTSSRSRQANFTNHMVNATGSSALVIDYSGHGDSPFEPKDTRPAQHVLEVIHAFEWIKTNYPNTKVTVVGNSYGSFLAAHLAHYRDFEKLVLRAPAMYRPESLYDLWSCRFNDEGRYRQDNENYRTDPTELSMSPLLATNELPFKGRTLVVIHENDEIIPQQTSNAYVAAFDADSFIAEGFNHAVSQSNISDAQLESYHKQIANWLKSY